MKRRERQPLPNEEEIQKLVKASAGHAEALIYTDERAKAFVCLMKALDLARGSAQKNDLYSRIDKLIEQSQSRSDIMEGLVKIHRQNLITDAQLTDYFKNFLDKDSDLGKLFWKKGSLDKDYVVYMIEFIPDQAVKRELLVAALGCDSNKTPQENKSGYLYEIVNESRYFTGTGAREKLRKELDTLAPGLRQTYQQKDMKAEFQNSREEMELPDVGARKTPK